jgi:hypothetical protein
MIRHFQFYLAVQKVYKQPMYIRQVIGCLQLRVGHQE